MVQDLKRGYNDWLRDYLGHCYGGANVTKNGRWYCIDITLKGDHRSDLYLTLLNDGELDFDKEFIVCDKPTLPQFSRGYSARLETGAYQSTNDVIWSAGGDAFGVKAKINVAIDRVARVILNQKLLRSFDVPGGR